MKSKDERKKSGLAYNNAPGLGPQNPKGLSPPSCVAITCKGSPKTGIVAIYIVGLVCVCVCVCARARVCVSLCVCARV